MEREQIENAIRTAVAKINGKWLACVGTLMINRDCPSNEEIAEIIHELRRAIGDE